MQKEVFFDNPNIREELSQEQKAEVIRLQRVEGVLQNALNSNAASKIESYLNWEHWEKGELAVSLFYTRDDGFCNLPFCRINYLSILDRLSKSNIMVTQFFSDFPNSHRYSRLNQEAQSLKKLLVGAATATVGVSELSEVPQILEDDYKKTLKTLNISDGELKEYARGMTYDFLSVVRRTDSILSIKNRQREIDFWKKEAIKWARVAGVNIDLEISLLERDLRTFRLRPKEIFDRLKMLTKKRPQKNSLLRSFFD